LFDRHHPSIERILAGHVAGVTSDTTARTWEWAHENVREVVQRGERPRWIRNGL
jgi:hypothetical protein